MFTPSLALKQSNILITGASSGIGRAAVETFLSQGCTVHGMDTLPSPWPDNTVRYFHHTCDVRDNPLPYIDEVAAIVHCAGVQDSPDDIDVNLKGTINIMNKYALENPHLMSVVTMASVSAHNSAEFPEYVASKGGVLAYTRWLAKKLAPQQITVNSISFGGVLTDLNRQVIEHTDKFQQIMDMTPMRKWATPEECADWIYFLVVCNKSMTAQDIVIDNGEMYNHTFVW